ncbi:RNA polymerase-associated factor [Balamuthia mandrillaris]
MMESDNKRASDGDRRSRTSSSSGSTHAAVNAHAHAKTGSSHHHQHGHAGDHNASKRRDSSAAAKVTSQQQQHHHSSASSSSSSSSTSSSGRSGGSTAKGHPHPQHSSASSSSSSHRGGSSSTTANRKSSGGGGGASARSSSSSSSAVALVPHNVLPSANGNKTNLLKYALFLCRLKFYNNLPPIPFDPKLLSLPLDPSRITSYQTTSLEINYQHDILSEPDLGIKIPEGLIDPHVYALPSTPMELPEEDKALLAAYDATPSTPKDKKKRKEVVRPSVSWLRKNTEYIPSEFSDVNKKARENIESQIGVGSQTRQVKKVRTREEIIHSIEKGFDVAQQTPVHPTNPNLKPVEVIPLLPDFELWSNSYSLVVFDDDPLPLGVPPSHPDAKQRTKEREHLIDNAIIKGFSTEDGEGEKQSFVTYFTPQKRTPSRKKKEEKEKEKEDDLFGDEEDEDEEGEPIEEYKWTREYIYRMGQDSENHYFFVWTPDGVYYNEIVNKVLLEKIKAKTTKERIKRHGRPEHVYKTHRALNEEEEKLRDERHQALHWDI